MLDHMAVIPDWPRLTPKKVTRTMWVYHWVAVAAACPIIGLLLRHKYQWALFFFLVSVVAMCLRCVAQGFIYGYGEARQHATEDAKEEAERKMRADLPRDIATDFPVAFPGEGFLYVLKFSTGGVKVGQTVDLRRRLTEHRRDADAYGVAITDYWVSPSHTNYLNNEIELIGFCDGVCATRGKREYFHGIEYADVVRFAAKSLAYYTNDPAVTGVDR